MSKTISLAEIGAIIDPVLDSEKGSASDARVSDFRDGVSWSPEEEKKLVSKCVSIIRQHRPGMVLSIVDESPFPAHIYQSTSTLASCMHRALLLT